MNNQIYNIDNQIEKTFHSITRKLLKRLLNSMDKPIESLIIANIHFYSIRLVNLSKSLFSISEDYKNLRNLLKINENNNISENPQKYISKEVALSGLKNIDSFLDSIDNVEIIYNLIQNSEIYKMLSLS